MKLLLYVIGCSLLSACIVSCRQDFTDGKTHRGTIVNHLDGGSYIHALKVRGEYAFFLDDKNDTLMRIYRNGEWPRPAKYVLKGSGRNNLLKPSFCKEVDGGSYKGIRVLDSDSHLKAVNPDAEPVVSSVRFINGLWNNTDYNFMSGEICALPFSPYKDFPFFFYNEKNGYYWVDPDKSVAERLPKKPVAYSVGLVLNEKKKRIATAYRYTNHVSFYNLDGIPEESFFTDKNIVRPTVTRDGIDIEASRKCFIETYGTEKYVYCLYDGSADFSNNSRLFIYTWEGKLQGTIALDRNIRTFAVSDDDCFIIAVSRSEHNGQDILTYRL